MKKSLFKLLILAPAILVAACGGSSSNGGGSTPTPTPTPEPTPEPTPDPKTEVTQEEFVKAAYEAVAKNPEYRWAQGSITQSNETRTVRLSNDGLGDNWEYYDGDQSISQALTSFIVNYKATIVDGIQPPESAEVAYYFDASGFKFTSSYDGVDATLIFNSYGYLVKYESGTMMTMSIEYGKNALPEKEDPQPGEGTKVTKDEFGAAIANLPATHPYSYAIFECNDFDGSYTERFNWNAQTSSWVPQDSDYDERGLDGADVSGFFESVESFEGASFEFFVNPLSAHLTYSQQGGFSMDMYYQWNEYGLMSNFKETVSGYGSASGTITYYK